jgi:glycine cleavage system pyridoxal-binding protein P
MTDNKKQVQEIAKQINEMIRLNAKEIASEKETESNSFEEFFWRFEESLREAKDIQQDFKEQGLTFSAIEAEGYLRAMLTIENLLESSTKYKKDS